MITDEQGREWLLQKLYDDGWIYLFEDYCGNVWAIKEKPRRNEYGGLELVGKCSPVSCIRDILPKTNLNQYLSIAEELGIVDWSKVPVDTPILVRDLKEQDWGKRYFAFFKDGKVYAWTGGATSWSAEDDKEALPWTDVKLAEV
jgi:hypothetical protein|nr:MAG TPA: hypothetical protein [Caudoviricetes sp.]